MQLNPTEKLIVRIHNIAFKMLARVRWNVDEIFETLRRRQKLSEKYSFFSRLLYFFTLSILVYKVQNFLGIIVSEIKKKCIL